MLVRTGGVGPDVALAVPCLCLLPPPMLGRLTVLVPGLELGLLALVRRCRRPLVSLHCFRSHPVTAGLLPLPGAVAGVGEGADRARRDDDCSSKLACLVLFLGDLADLAS
eukprot:12311553-Heterocapsa_arctica.AAC.1